jgi:hypothetical protein
MEIAIGLWRHQGTQETGQLERFAAHVGAKTYADVYAVDILPTEEMLERMLRQATRIHVNLDGLATTGDDLASIIDLGSRGIDYTPPSGGGNFTNWEIWRIHQEQELLERTLFYLNGKVVRP